MGKFIKLVRWPNLLFILITQFLFYFIFFPFVYRTKGLDDQHLHLTRDLFFFLSAASLFIAAAGYIINDYFDIKIDIINKPDKVLIGNNISKRIAIRLYIALSLSGLVLSGYLSVQLQNLWILLGNIIAIALLFFYSAALKKKYLIGNVVISLLTAWVIFVLPVAEINPKSEVPDSLLHLAIIYGGFAFLISTIRELVKDIEDVEGDRQFGCTTIPIVSGIKAAKVFAMALILILACLVSILITYILLKEKWLMAVYSVAFVVIPLVILLNGMKKATKTDDFHKLSALSKGIMLGGVMTMIFFFI